MEGSADDTFRADDDPSQGQVARVVQRLTVTPDASADPEAAPSTLPFRS